MKVWKKEKVGDNAHIKDGSTEHMETVMAHINPRICVRACMGERETQNFVVIYLCHV